MKLNLINIKKNLFFLFVVILIKSTSFCQNKDPRPKDQANVFWNGNYPLYSLSSDKQIYANSNGNYHFWGTTNENPIPQEYTISKGQVLYVYKFIDYNECVLFCNEVRKNKGLSPLKLEVLSQPTINNNTSVLPNSYEKFNEELNNIIDPIEKIKFLNSVIFEIKSSSDEMSDLNAQLFASSYINKILIILPDLYDSPFIEENEWKDLLSFVELFPTDFWKEENPNKTQKTERSCFLYWNICIRQKLNEIDLTFHKMLVNEFTREDFVFGETFYDQCKQIIQGEPTRKISHTRTCNYTFSKPVLSVTWIDNRTKCCSPFCDNYSKYSDAKSANLKKTEEQYLNDLLEAHFLETNASEEHKMLDYDALAEFKLKHYANIGFDNKDFNDILKMMDIMSSAMSGAFSKSFSGLTYETKDDKIKRLKSKKRSVNMYNVSKFCSTSCEEYCDESNCKCY